MINKKLHDAYHLIASGFSNLHRAEQSKRSIDVAMALIDIHKAMELIGDIGLIKWTDGIYVSSEKYGELVKGKKDLREMPSMER